MHVILKFGFKPPQRTGANTAAVCRVSAGCWWPALAGRPAPAFELRVQGRVTSPAPPLHSGESVRPEEKSERGEAWAVGGQGPAGSLGCARATASAPVCLGAPRPWAAHRGGDASEGQEFPVVSFADIPTALER